MTDAEKALEAELAACRLRCDALEAALEALRGDLTASKAYREVEIPERTFTRKKDGKRITIPKHVRRYPVRQPSKQ